MLRATQHCNMLPTCAIILNTCLIWDSWVPYYVLKVKKPTKRREGRTRKTRNGKVSCLVFLFASFPTDTVGDLNLTFILQHGGRSHCNRLITNHGGMQFTATNHFASGGTIGCSIWARDFCQHRNAEAGRWQAAVLRGRAVGRSSGRGRRRRGLLAAGEHRRQLDAPNRPQSAARRDLHDGTAVREGGDPISVVELKGRIAIPRFRPLLNSTLITRKKVAPNLASQVRRVRQLDLPHERRTGHAGDSLLRPLLRVSCSEGHATRADASAPTRGRTAGKRLQSWHDKSYIKAEWHQHGNTDGNKKPMDGPAALNGRSVRM